MRTIAHVTGWGLITLLAVPAVSPAQHRPRSAEELAREYNEGIRPIQEEMDALRSRLNKSDLSLEAASKLIEQQSALRKKADKFWSSTEVAIDGSFKQARDSIFNYNSRARRLDYESAVIGSKVDQLNNVARNPKKEDFEQSKAKMSEAWEKNYGSRLKLFGEEWAAMKEQVFKNVKEKYGIDLQAEGYGRIGTSNPYDGRAYYKYYDKDGRAVQVQWSNDAEGWARYQREAEIYRRRMRDEKDQLSKAATTLMDFAGKAELGERSMRGQITELGGLAQRIRGGSTDDRAPYRVVTHRDIVIPGKYHFLQSPRHKRLNTLQEVRDFLKDINAEPKDANIYDRNGSRIDVPE